MAHHVLQIHPYATGPAAETVKNHQDDCELVFYGGWVRDLLLLPARSDLIRYSPFPIETVLPVYPEVLDSPRRTRNTVQIRRDQPVQQEPRAAG